MASKKKLDILNNLNITFEEIGSKTLARDYLKSFNGIQKEAVKLLETKEKLTKADLRRIFRKFPLNPDKWETALYNSHTLSSISIIIANDKKMTKNERKKNAPIVKLMKNYSVRRPERLVSNINKYTQIFLAGRTLASLTSKQRKEFDELSKFYTNNLKAINKTAKSFKKNVVKTNKLVMDNLGKDILKDFKRFKNKIIEEVDKKTGEIIKRPLSEKEINQELKKKYTKAKPRVERILRTQLHSQNELIKEIEAKRDGYNKKVWHNNPSGGKGGPVRGSNSRDRYNHVMVNNVKINVDDKFKLIGGPALYPGDPKLPAGDIINCRCFLTYEK